MRQDYAKRPSYRKPNNTKRNHWLLWLVTISIFVTLTLSLVHLGKNRSYKLHHQQPLAIPAHETKPKKITKKVVAAVNKTKPKPKITPPPPPAVTPQFDFYTLLPQKKIPSIIAQYELDIKTTEDLEEANHLKAQISQLGYQPNIVTTNVDDALFYLVTIGPFDSKVAAVDVQKKLSKNKIYGKIKKYKYY